MKLTKEQENKLTEMAFAEKSNKEIAEALGIEVKDVHATRSRLGITIPKVKETLAKGTQALAKRAKEDIQQEIDKVQKARTEAFKKVERCNERIDQLYKELGHSMATIRGTSDDKTVTAIYDSSSDKLFVYLPNYRVLIFEPSDLQSTIEALGNLKQNVISTLGSDALK